MYQRLSAQGLEAVHLAEEQARGMSHEYLGTEHLLLGLLAQENTTATAVLRSLNVELQRVRSEAERIVGLGERHVPGSIPLTPLARLALDHTVKQAETEGHELASGEDLLLGLLAVPDGLASRILTGMDISVDQVRARLATASDPAV